MAVNRAITAELAAILNSLSKYMFELGKVGWGARDRTWEWRNQNPLPYRLATPQYMAKPLEQWQNPVKEAR